MATGKSVWKLKRYGRFIPKAKESSWKVFESNESKGRLELTILESGHLFITQAQELLEGFSLLNAQSFLKTQQKSDSLLVNITLKGGSRLIRLQFEGSSRSEAVDLCKKAVDRLQEYLLADTPEQAGPSSRTADTTRISNQQEQPPSHLFSCDYRGLDEHGRCETMGGNPRLRAFDDEDRKTPVAAQQAAHDVTQESLSIKQLAQYFLGEHGLSLPSAYRHFTLPPGDVEGLLRLCLLDSGFPAFVEEVENKLKDLSQK